MKKIINIVLLSAFVTVLSISCNKDGDPTPPRAISFGKIATRVESVSEIEEFSVWATVSSIGSTDVSYEPFFINERVYRDPVGSDNWTYDDTKYWIDNTLFNFVAAYPYDEAGDIFTFENNAIELSVSETPSVVDYLMATHETNTGADDFDFSAPVPLQFKHMLTNVSLNIWRDEGKHKNDDMRVKKVTLSNICKGGTYSSALKAWTPTSDKKLTLSYEDNNLSDSDKIGAVIIKNDGTLEASGGDPLTPLFAEQQQPLLLLIPQTIDGSNSVSLKIEYELKRQNAADWESAELETILPSITWKSGQRYTYNVVLSSVTDITVYYIQTKVDPWGTPQVGGTVIIK